MNQRYNVVYPIERDGAKTIWHNIGVAYPTEDGTGFIGTINSIPLHWDGKFLLFPAEDKPRRYKKS